MLTYVLELLRIFIFFILFWLAPQMCALFFVDFLFWQYQAVPPGHPDIAPPPPVKGHANRMIECPHALVGYLIGKKGAMIKRIKVGCNPVLGLLSTSLCASSPSMLWSRTCRSHYKTASAIERQEVGLNKLSRTREDNPYLRSDMYHGNSVNGPVS